MRPPSPHTPIAPSAEALTAAPNPALALLLEAHDYSAAVGESVWEFAVELPALLEHCTASTVRWLISRGLVEHRAERTGANGKKRDFRRIASLSFPLRTCLVLTESGIRRARQTHSAQDDRSHPPGVHLHTGKQPVLPRPRWDAEMRELWLGESLVKRFKVPALNQELILAAFEEERWRRHIDDPLPPHNGQNAKRRLHTAIDRLNRNQVHHLIGFHGDGTGRGIYWESLLNRR